MIMTKRHTDLVFALLLCIIDLSTLSNGSNEYTTNGINYWNSTTDFVPIQNQSYGTIQLKTGFRMTFDILYHGKTNTANWENIFRIGHAGHSSTDFKCSKNDRFPAMWINDASNAFVFDVSDQTNCFRQYANFIISPHTFYHIIIQYNSTWIYIAINNHIITNEARADSTELIKLGTDIDIYISTVTSIPANVTLSNIQILTYDDNTIHTSPPPPPSNTISPTNIPSNSPSIMPTYTPTINPTTTPLPTVYISKSPTKKPTTFLPSIFTTVAPEDTFFDVSSTDLNDLDTTIMSEKQLQVTSTLKTTLYSLISTHYTTTIGIHHAKEDKTLSFEVIFYILTGCAMGGILFCVCACCCFGCIINKKIKRLADDECHIGDDIYHKNVGVHGDKLAGDKVRLSTMSGDSEDSGDSGTIAQENDDMAMESIDIQSPTTSPSQCISNRYSSPSHTMHNMHHNHSKTCTPTMTNSNQTVIELTKNRYRTRTEFTERIPSMNSPPSCGNKLQHKISINRNNESIELSVSDIDTERATAITQITQMSHPQLQLQLNPFNTQQTCTQTCTQTDIDDKILTDDEDKTQLQNNDSGHSILSPLMAESGHGHGHFFGGSRKIQNASNPSHYSLYVHKHSSVSPNMHKLQLQQIENHRKVSKNYQIHIDYAKVNANANVNEEIVTSRNGNGNGNGEVIVYDDENGQMKCSSCSLGNIEIEKSRNHKCISYGTGDDDDEEVEVDLEEMKLDVDADEEDDEDDKDEIRCIASFKSMKSPNTNTNNTPGTAKSFLQLPANAESLRSNVSNQSNQSNSSSSSSGSNNSNSSNSSSSASSNSSSNSYSYSANSNSNSISNSSGSSASSSSSNSNSNSNSSATSASSSNSSGSSSSASTYTAITTSLSSTRYKSTPNMTNMTTTITSGYKSTPNTYKSTPNTITYKSTPNTIRTRYKSTPNTMININTPEICNDDDEDDEDDDSQSNMSDSSCYYSNAQHSEF